MQALNKGGTLAEYPARVLLFAHSPRTRAWPNENACFRLHAQISRVAATARLLPHAPRRCSERAPAPARAPFRRAHATRRARAAAVHSRLPLHRPTPSPGRSNERHLVARFFAGFSRAPCHPPNCSSLRLLGCTPATTWFLTPAGRSCVTFGEILSPSGPVQQPNAHPRPSSSTPRRAPYLA